jgi:hypothetical protein
MHYKSAKFVGRSLINAVYSFNNDNYSKYHPFAFSGHILHPLYAVRHTYSLPKRLPLSY